MNTRGQFCTMMQLNGQTVVTRSTSTYRTELSLCQLITSLSSNVAVSTELNDFKRVCSIDEPRQLRLILLYGDDEKQQFVNSYFR